MARIFLGSSTTNSSGQATYTLTGDGGGIKDIVAESGTLVSQPYTVYDCTFYDTGLSDSTANVVLSRMSREKTSNGAVITATGNNAWAIMKQNSQVFSNNCIIEFDLVANDTPNTQCGIDLSTSGDAYQGKIYFEDLGHYKIRVTPTGITAMTGSQTISPPQTYPQSDIRISFNLGQTGDSITYKDFRIYPI